MMSRKIVIVFALGALLGSSGCVRLPHYVKVMQEMNEITDPKERALRLEEEVRKNPGDLDIYTLQLIYGVPDATIDKQLKIIDGAIAHPEFHNFTAKDFWFGLHSFSPGDLYSLRGGILIQKSEYERAADDFSKAISAYTDLLSQAATFKGNGLSMAGMVAGSSDARTIAKQNGMEKLAGFYAQRASAYATIGNCEEAKADMLKVRGLLKNKKEYEAEVANSQQKELSMLQAANKSILDQIVQLNAEKLERIKNSYPDKDAPDKKFLDEYFSYAPISLVSQKSMQECMDRNSKKNMDACKPILDECIKNKKDTAACGAIFSECIIRNNKNLPDCGSNSESPLYKCILGEK